MHIYGGLMWQLGKFFNRPESIKVYLGSYRSEPCDADSRSSASFCTIFRQSTSVVRKMLKDLPHNALVARAGGLMNHLEHLEVHLKLLSELRKQTSRSLFSSSCTTTKLLTPPDAAATFVAQFMDVHLGRGHMHDVSRFVGALSKLGGLCNLPVPTAHHFAVVTKAKAQLVEILSGSPLSMRDAQEL
jgi:hypothetical protein